MSSEKFRLIREVAIRYVGKPRRAPRSMTDPAQIAAYLRRRVRDDAREHLVAIYLDARPSSDRRRDRLDRHGDLDRGAPARGVPDGGGGWACALVLAHSHPSGDARPSDADLAVTRRLACAGRLLGIELIDHIVWTRGGEFRSIARMCPEAFRSDA